MPMKRVIVGVMIATLLPGCTSTLQPVTLSVPSDSDRAELQYCAKAKDAPTYVSPTSRQRLEWMVCELHARAIHNLGQAQRWENRTEWRDIPLIGAATAVAGLLLFGKRDANNALKPGVQDAVTGIGFGAAALATFANYLSPQKARDILRQGARGHFCIATQGEMILSVWNSIERSQERSRLANDLGTLSQMLVDNPNGFGKIDASRVIQAQAMKALALHHVQLQERDTASLLIGETTWNFGLDLMTRTDRSEQNVEALTQSITKQAQSMSSFAASGASATNPSAPAAVSSLLPALRPQVGKLPSASPTPDQLSELVATETNELIADLPNVEALVLGFDKCAATALAGGTARVEHIQRVSLQ